VAAAAQQASTAPSLPDLGRLGIQLTTDASLAIVVLLVATTPSVYKPWGAIRDARATGVWIAIGALGALVLTVVIVHLAGGGRGHH